MSYIIVGQESPVQTVTLCHPSLTQMLIRMCLLAGRGSAARFAESHQSDRRDARCSR
jgi:hypothetical protein